MFGSRAAEGDTTKVAEGGSTNKNAVDRLKRQLHLDFEVGKGGF